MQCHDICELLSGYIDEVLTPEEKKRVEAHVAKCSVCAGELRDLQQTVRLLQSMGDVMPPAGFREELMGRLALENQLNQERECPLPSELQVKAGKLLKLPPVWRFAAAAVIVLSLGTGVALGVFNKGMEGLSPEAKITAENSGSQSTVNSETVQQKAASETADQQPEATLHNDAASASENTSLTPEEAAGQNLKAQQEGAVNQPAANNLAGEKSDGQPVKTYKQVRLPDRSSQKTKSPGTQKENQPAASAATADESVTEKQMIKSAQVNLNVDSYKTFETYITALANQYGGMVTGSTVPSKGNQGRISLKIPEKEFGNVLAEVETRGTVTSEQISGKEIGSDSNRDLTGLKSTSLQDGQNQLPKTVVTESDASFSYIEINIMENS